MGALAVWMDLASAEETFKKRADGIQRDLAHRFGSTEAVLTALVGLHHASDDLRPDEFAALSRELLAAYPFIRTVALSRKIAVAERQRFESDEELHLIQRVHQPQGCQAFIAASQGHEHLLLCQSCGQVRFFEGDDLEALIKSISKKSGYQIKEHWLQLFGLCEACQS